VPWIAIGGAALFLAVVGAFMLVDRQESAASSTTPPASSGITDAAALTPVEAAEQLFNHVMAASERGDTAEATRFAPMALEAYRQLATLDEDAHYHVGLIHVTLGDTESAQAELDAIRSTAPNHLLGIMLEEAVAEAKGDDDGVARAYQRFLDAYDVEITAGRSEYEGHRTGIEGFRSRARAAVGNR
jgi:hypothetical protein